MPPEVVKRQTANIERFLWAGDADARDLSLNGFLPAPRYTTMGRPSTLSSRVQQAPSIDPLAATAVAVSLEVDPLIRLTGGHGAIRRFKVLQQFECIVTDVLEDAVVAELIDLTDSSRPNEIAEIPLSDIPSSDHTLLTPGCVFYWILGFETSVGGQRNRVSEIRVRRTPKWSENDIEAIEAEGQELFKQFAGTQDKTS